MARSVIESPMTMASGPGGVATTGDVRPVVSGAGGMSTNANATRTMLAPSAITDSTTLRISVARIRLREDRGGLLDGTTGVGQATLVDG